MLASRCLCSLGPHCRCILAITDLYQGIDSIDPYVCSCNTNGVAQSSHWHLIAVFINKTFPILRRNLLEAVGDVEVKIYARPLAAFSLAVLTRNDPAC